MLRNVLLILWMGLFFNFQAQSPNDILRIKSPHPEFLENLIKIKIDSVRKNKGISQLANDSGLYVVAKFHSDYLSTNNKTSSTQLNDTMKTAGMRLAYFGIKEYLTKELVHSIYVHRPVNIKPDPNSRIKTKVIFTTYNDVANYFVSQWALNSKTKDFLSNNKYNVIGLAVTINKTNDNIKVVTFLGRPFLKYRFIENKKMFPYSDYQTRDTLSSFNQVQKTIVEDRPFKIKSTTKEKCSKCEATLSNIDFKLNVTGSKIYVSASNIENVEEFTKFISSAKNGLMLETIEYEDYHPGNPAYYEKPTRRNETYIYNGEISDPKLGTDLLKGFKPEKGTFKSFIAKNPKVKTYHEFNLYIIYKGMLCGLKRFTSPVGDPMSLYKELKLDYQFDSSYAYQLKVDTTNTSFSYNKGSFLFDQVKFKQQLSKNKNYDTKLLTLTIDEPVVNYNLEKPINFDSVSTVLLNQIQKEFPEVNIKLIRNTNVDGLKKHYSAKKDSIANFSIDQFKTMFLDTTLIIENRKYLESAWRAKLQFVSYDNVQDDLEKLYVDLINKIDSTEEPSKEDMKLAIGIHSRLLMESIKTGRPINVEASKIPRFRIAAKTIVANQVAYNYNSLSDYPKKTLDKLYKEYLKPIYEGSLAIKTDKVNFLKFSCNHLGSKPFDGAYRSNNLTAMLKEIAPTLEDSVSTELQNAYDIKLTYYYSFYSKAASKFEHSIDHLKKVYGNGDKETKYKLALTLAYYKKNEGVKKMIKESVLQDSDPSEMIILRNKINQEYTDVFGVAPSSYYQDLISSFELLGKEKWCGQFVGESNISFQIFDYLPLYHKYCDECAPYNNQGTKITY